jgi:hypothetical protein
MRIVVCAYVNGYQCGIQRALKSIAISVPYDPALGSCQAITPRSPTPSLLKPCDAQRALLLVAGTLLYQTVAEHYETWLELAITGHSGPGRPPQPCLRQAFVKYLDRPSVQAWDAKTLRHTCAYATSF